MKMSNINTTDGSYVNYPSCFFHTVLLGRFLYLFTHRLCAAIIPTTSFELPHRLQGSFEELNAVCTTQSLRIRSFEGLSTYSLISSRRCHLTTSFKIEKPTIPTLFTETHGCYLRKVGAATCISLTSVRKQFKFLSLHLSNYLRTRARSPYL